jgi:hypothetical protein
MKVESFIIRDNTLTLSFDVSFRQITYVKMESDEDTNCCHFECEQMEIKYSKKKNTLSLFIDNSTNKIIIFFTKIDTRDTLFSYFIDIPQYRKSNAQETNTNADLIERGFKKLMSGDIKITQNNNDDKIKTIVCPIKNQNIFAKVIRKV